MKNNGFNLIELMIVVAIIVFLATIAIPRYKHYFTKARQAEVAINLASLHTAQEAYWATHNKYTTVLWGKDGIDWKPQGYKGGGEQENFFYTYGFNFPGAQEGMHYFTGKLKTIKEALGYSFASNDGFIAKAAGKEAGANVVDLWAINESRSLIHIQD